MKRIVLLVIFLFSGFNTLLLHATTASRQTPVVDVIQKTAGSVVNISTERIALLQKNPFWGRYGNSLDALFQDFMTQGMLPAVKLQSIGSGVVIREEGLIVTNAHVVNMATRIYVIFNDGKTVEGTVVVVNQQDDLAFIKIEPPYPLKAVTLANPDEIMIGETAVAIGNPIGLQNSVSVGVISGTNRTFPMPNSSHVFTDLIQTDASINFGSSGGALLNLDGELIGVNLAVVLNAQNISFAVSSRKIADGLIYYDNWKANQPVRVPVQ